MPNPPPPMLPIYLQILLAVAAVSITVMAAFVIYTLIYLKGQFDSIERTVTQLKPEVEQLLRDSKSLMTRANAIADKVDKQMDDIEHVTSKARQWLDRAGNIVETAAPIVESPIFFFVNKLKTIRSFFHGVFQVLKNP